MLRTAGLQTCSRACGAFGHPPHLHLHQMADVGPIERHLEKAHWPRVIMNAVSLWSVAFFARNQHDFRLSRRRGRSRRNGRSPCENCHGAKRARETPQHGSSTFQGRLVERGLGEVSGKWNAHGDLREFKPDSPARDCGKAALFGMETTDREAAPQRGIPRSKLLSGLASPRPLCLPVAP